MSSWLNKRVETKHITEMCTDIFEREFTWGKFGNTWEIYKNVKESDLMIELIKNLNIQGYSQRMRLQRQKLLQYDDSKYKLSFLPKM